MDLRRGHKSRQRFGASYVRSLKIGQRSGKAAGRDKIPIADWRGRVRGNQLPAALIRGIINVWLAPEGSSRLTNVRHAGTELV